MIPQANKVITDRFTPKQPVSGDEGNRRTPDNQETSGDQRGRLWDRQRHPH
jgi:hypothetical protein